MFFGTSKTGGQFLRFLTAISFFILIAPTSFGISIQDSLRNALKANPDSPELLNQLAEALLPDSTNQSRALLEQALLHSTAQENPEEYAKACYNYGDSYWYDQDYANAIIWFEKAAHSWEKLGNLLEAASCYNDVGYSSVEIDRFDEALRSYKKSLFLLLEIDDEDNIAAVLTNIARVYQGVSKYDSAIFYSEQAIALSEAPGMEEELTSALGNLGVVYKTMGNYDKALDYYNRAYAVSRKLGFPNRIAVDLNNIAALYVAWGKYDLAVDYFRQALEIDYETGDMAQAQMTLNNLAHVIQELGNSDSALAMYKKSLAISEKLGRYGNSSVTKINIGSLYYEAGNYQEALPYYISAVEITQKLGMRYVTAGGLQNLGATYLALGNYAEARANFDRSMKIAKEISALPIIQNVYESRSKLYEKTGKTQLALEAYRNYRAVKDSIFTEESQTQLAEMQARYETEKKQQQIELLIKDNQLQRTELREKQITLISLGGGIALLAISALIIWFLYIQKSKANRLLVEKNLELMKHEEMDCAPDVGHETKASLPDKERDRILLALESLMKKKKVFVQKQISLASLAADLQTNTSYLSRIINENFEMNFSNFLNIHRIREARKMFGQNKHESMTLEGIAESIGFQSRSTFNVAFKKITGVTPTIYLKNLKDINENNEMRTSMKSGV